MTTEKAKKIFVGSILFLTVVLVPILNVSAQGVDDKYKVLAPLPGVGQNGGTTTLKEYLPAIFKLAIGLSAVFAFLMIVLGGFQYMSSDAIQGKEDGRNRVKNAIYGLVLVIAAYLILYTVNPKLLTLNLNIETVEIKAQYGVGGELVPSTSSDNQCPSGQCVPIPVGIRISSRGTTVNQAIAPKLSAMNTALKEAGLTLTINEAYPPTIKHQDPCHQNGTCIDAARVPDNKIKTYIDIGYNAGLRPIYEVETPERKNTIIQASCGTDQTCRTSMDKSVLVLEPKNGKRQITGEHFSVYNR